MHCSCSQCAWAPQGGGKAFSIGADETHGANPSPLLADDPHVQYSAVSSFVFLRFFAVAVLSPHTFQLRPHHPVSPSAFTGNTRGSRVHGVGPARVRLFISVCFCFYVCVGKCLWVFGWYVLWLSRSFVSPCICLTIFFQCRLMRCVCCCNGGAKVGVSCFTGPRDFAHANPHLQNHSDAWELGESVQNETGTANLLCS